LKFEGRAAFVTGAGGGIGGAVARRLVEEGAAVAVVDLDGEKARAVAQEIGGNSGHAVPLEVDITNEDAVKGAVGQARRQIGEIDILVNSVAGDPNEGVHDLAHEEWDRDFDVTLKGPFFCIKHCLPGMIARRRGCVVNVATVGAFLALGNEAYAAAKAGLVSLTKSVAVRYGPVGIRCVGIAPGTILTGAPAEQKRLERDPEVFDRLLKWYPIRRLGKPDDVANAVLFLASEEADWITGCVLPVDGGLLAGNIPMIQDLVGDWPELAEE